jgi:hypothetical protein
MGELEGRQAREELALLTATELQRFRVAGYGDYVEDIVGKEAKL